MTAIDSLAFQQRIPYVWLPTLAKMLKLTLVDRDELIEYLLSLYYLLKTTHKTQLKELNDLINQLCNVQNINREQLDYYDRDLIIKGNLKYINIQYHNLISRRKEMKIFLQIIKDKSTYEPEISNLTISQLEDLRSYESTFNTMPARYIEWANKLLKELIDGTYTDF